MTHFILHNPQAANGNGMEIYEVSDVQKMLDRVTELLDGAQLNPISKKHAGMLLDGRFDELCPRRSNVALRDITLSGGHRSVNIYAASLGKAL